MRRRLATLLAVGALLSGMLITGGVVLAANQAANLDQCANDPAPSPSTDGCNSSANQWVNGNLGSSKSLYFEGDSIPYRMTLTNLVTGGTIHRLTIEWDTTKGGKHAIDYLTTFNQTVGNANPCLGVSGCSAGSFAVSPAIPADPQVTAAGVTPIAGVFRIYGGAITSLARPTGVGSTTCTAANSLGSYCYSNGTGFTGDKSAAITINFTASVANPVIAWGGHIATRANWGQGNSAGAVSGSPYHMRLIDLDGAGGNQDRSLSADAVILLGSITIIKDVTGGTDPQDFAFTETASGTPLLTPSTFTLDDDPASTPPSNTQTYTGISNFISYTFDEGAVSNWSLSFGTPPCTVTSQNGGTQVLHGTTGITISIKEGENVTCTFLNTKLAPSLSVLKQVKNGAGGTYGSTASASPGDTLYYKVTVTNSGTGSSSSVPVQDDLTNVLLHSTYDNDCSNGCTNNTGGAAPKTLNWTIANLAAGAHVDLTYSVTLDGTFPTGTTDLVNTVVSAGTNCAAATPTPAACTTDTTVTASASVAASKQVKDGAGGTYGSTASASPGDTLYYRIHIANTGNASALVSPTDDLSNVLAHATFGSCTASVDGGVAAATTCSVASNILSFASSPFTVAAHTGTLDLVYTVTLDSTFPPGTTHLINAIVVDGTNCAAATPTPAACTTDTTVTASANLSANKEVSTNGTYWSASASASPGDTLYYRISIANTGSADGTVSPSDDLSNVLTHASFNNDCMASVNGGPAAADACSLDAGDMLAFAGSPFTVSAHTGTLVLTYSVTLDPTFPEGDTHLVNAIVVAGTNCAATVPTPADCTTDTTVTAAPDLGAIKQVKVGVGGTYGPTANASPGDTLYYRITITNTGNADGMVSPSDDLSDVLTHGTFNDDCAVNGGGSSPGNCSIDVSDVITFAGSPFTVTAGGQLVLTYSVLLDSSGYTVAEHLINLIVVPGSNCPAVQPANPDPNCTTDTTVTPVPDVTITKVARTTFPPTFDVTVDAIGTGTSTNVVATDTLPAGWHWAITSADFDPAATCDNDGNSVTTFDPTDVVGGTLVTCSLGDMAEGTSQAFTLTAVVGPSVENTANVGSNNQSTSTNKTSTAKIDDILKLL
ncbi:MAG TPA: hypothetical protein VGM49_05655 [Candidatus Limnocylindrales bacterium]